MPPVSTWLLLCECVKAMDSPPHLGHGLPILEDDLVCGKSAVQRGVDGLFNGNFLLLISVPAGWER